MSGATSQFAVQNLSGLTLRGITFDARGRTGSNYQLYFEGACNNCDIDGLVFEGNTYEERRYSIQAINLDTINNSTFRNMTIGSICLHGNDNIFDNCQIDWLRITGADSTGNRVGATSYVGAVTALQGGLVDSVMIGDLRGYSAPTFFTKRVSLDDNSVVDTPYDITIPIYDRGRYGALYTAIVQYSHRGSHYVHLQTIIRTGDNAYGQVGTPAKVNNIADVVVKEVTSDHITFSLTYRYAGIFSVTLIG